MKDETLFKFILRENFVTLTVLGSIFTFAFISSLKGDIVDPILHVILPEEFFGYMNITLREGDKQPVPTRQVEMRVGNFFREFVTWILAISILYMLTTYRFPDEPRGNPGAAVL